ncbi:hypothetical protein GIB67_002474 [Kingdonia uniflora]|uniref:Late embryogenesis abundant protein n=1 Tax=Kingdonia uniflora TaxID=39325 RepID=A0A7J7LAS9_9MAGN|nr:hypothetical protein GIB67_002474 [Kingdonia uniflora]
MSKSGEEKKSGGGEGGGETDKVKEGLPMETSPYVNYSDLEDYKRKGYGTEGHVDPVVGRGAGGTDAPTPSGGVCATKEHVEGNVNREGAP